MSDQSSRPTVTIADLVAYSDQRFRSELDEIKAGLASPDFWYPYDSLSNLAVLEQTLTSEHRDLATLAGGRPIADIGAATGTSHFSSLGMVSPSTSLISARPTSMVLREPDS